MNQQSAMEMVSEVHRQGRSALSEYEAKQVLAAYGIPITREVLLNDPGQLNSAVKQIGFPLVMKACCANIAHKTEKNLVRTDIRSSEEAAKTFEEIFGDIDNTMEGCGVLVQEMVSGKRELVMGMTRDAQFGPCVMFGLGGIFTEVLKDISFAKAPLDNAEALALMKDFRGRRILKEVRGMPAADLQMLSTMLINVGRIGLDMEAVAEIDINPVILAGSRPVAVDALIVLA